MHATSLGVLFKGEGGGEEYRGTGGRGSPHLGETAPPQSGYEHTFHKHTKHTQYNS